MDIKDYEGLKEGTKIKYIAKESVDLGGSISLIEKDGIVFDVEISNVIDMVGRRFRINKERILRDFIIE